MGALKLTYPTHEDYFKNHEETSFLKVVHNREASSPESKNYYAFGSGMSGRSFRGYRYGFDGQEKDDEIVGKGNSNTAEFWQYDGRLGRRWNVDPKDQFYISRYSVFGDNPIYFIDKLGNEFDPASIDIVNNYKKAIKDKIKQLFIYQKLNIKLMNPSSGNEHYWAAINDANIAIGYLNRSLIQVGQMEISKQKFILNELLTGEEPGTSVNKDRVIVMKVPKGYNAFIGHELLHGYQYLSGKLSYDMSQSSTGILNDITDEIEAYKLQWSIDYFSPNRVSYNDINKEYVRSLSVVYNNEKLYNEETDLTSTLTKKRLLHYFGTGYTTEIEKSTKKFIGKPITEFMSDRKEFYIKEPNTL